MFVNITGASVQSYYGKRSLPDDEDEADHAYYGWARILETLHAMDEHFRQLGLQKSEDECRKRLVCQLSSNNKLDSLTTSLNHSHEALRKLATKLR